MESNTERYDNVLLGILQTEGKIAPFLDVIIGFLYRRTDFFRIMKADTDKLGFPPGFASKLLKNIFTKYEALALKESEKREQIKHKKESANQDHQKLKCKQSLADTSKEQGSPKSDTVNNIPDTPLLNSPQAEVPQSSKAEGSDSTSDFKTEEKKSEKEQDNDEEDPEMQRQRRELQANPLTYNGAERDGYFWSQNIMEVDVRVKVPKSVMKGKQVKVDIKSKHLHVAMQDTDSNWEDVIDNDFTWDVNREDSMWTLVPGEFIHINLEKRQERWWENVFKDEPKINTRKIDCSRPMTDLDDEAQAKIEEMMFNQRQKQLGLPQSHEMKTNEMLRKAWDAEGSPFKGQPFDPSKFSVDSNSGVVNINQ